MADLAGIVEHGGKVGAGMIEYVKVRSALLGTGGRELLRGAKYEES